MIFLLSKEVKCTLNREMYISEHYTMKTNKVMPKSESRVSAVWEQKVPKHNVKHFRTKTEWLRKVLLIQAYQQILGKILCLASERRRLIARLQFRCRMLVVLPVFTHQTVKLEEETG